MVWRAEWAQAQGYQKSPIGCLLKIGTSVAPPSVSIEHGLTVLGCFRLLHGKMFGSIETNHTRSGQNEQTILSCPRVCSTGMLGWRGYHFGQFQCHRGQGFENQNFNVCQRGQGFFSGCARESAEGQKLHHIGQIFRTWDLSILCCDNILITEFSLFLQSTSANFRPIPPIHHVDIQYFCLAQ